MLQRIYLPKDSTLMLLIVSFFSDVFVMTRKIVTPSALTWPLHTYA